MHEKEKNVLIVDDNPDARQAAILLMRLEGYKYDVAGSGDEALLKIELLKPNAILLDINMGLGKMSGIDVCKEVKSNPRLKDIYIMIISGKEDKEIIQEAMRAGADDYVCKPYRPADIKNKLNKALS